MYNLLKFIKKGLIAAIAVALMAPITANAANFPDLQPTYPLPVDPNIVKIGAHRTAVFTPQMLGAEVTTIDGNITTLEQARSSNMLNLFGTCLNESPSVYWWNFYYNLNRIGTVQPTAVPLTIALLPTGADYSGVTASTNPDIYLGIAATNGYIYPDTATKGVAYKCNDLNDMIDTAYNLAYKMNYVKSGNELNASPASGRYGNPVDIAKKYEEYVKATKYYVLSQLGNTAMKKIAIVGEADSAGNYKLYSTADFSGTAYTCRAAEFLDGTTINIASDLGSTATAAQLKASGVDYIFTVGFQGNTTTENALRTADAVPAGATVIDELPKAAYGIIMNSAENAFGVGLFQSIVYPEYFDVDSNHNNGNEANAAVAYFYSNFYHLKTCKIACVAEMFESTDFPVDFNHNCCIGDSEDCLVGDCECVDGSMTNVTYHAMIYSNCLESGLNFYCVNEDKFEGTSLELSDNYGM